MARHYASPRNPQTPQELARVLTDPASAAEAFGGRPESWAAFEAEFAEQSPLVNKIVDERVQLAVQKQAQDEAARPRTAPGIASGTIAGSHKSKLYNKRAPGVAAEGAVQLGEYPLARMIRIANRRNETLQQERAQLQAVTNTAIANALSERVPSEGGFLVPENLRSSLLELSLEQAIIRPRCTTVQMDSLRVPYPSIDDTSHENTVYGGVQGFWTEEGGSLVQSAPSFARVILDAKKLTLYTAVPNELLQDNAEAMLQAWIEASWPAALAYFEDDGFINGTGVGEPQGFLNAPAAITVPTTTTNVITFNDLVSVYTRLLPQALPGAVWLMSPDVKGQLLQMAVTASGTAIAPPVWLAGLQAIEGEPSTLFGHPVFVSEKMPSSTSSNTTAAGALSLCNFGYYLLGERGSLQMAMSTEYLFANDMTAYRLIERADGRVWPQAPLQPRNGGPTLSPFVLLDTTS